MENKTAVTWLWEALEEWSFQVKWPHDIFEKAEQMEKEQHGETWDAALIQLDKRGGVLVRAVCDFDEYWENRNNNSDEV